MKVSVTFKISLGYAIVVAVLCLAVWLVYGNTRSLMDIDKARREMTIRRNTADSLVYTMLEMSNSERAVSLGRSEEWHDYDSLINRSAALTDSLSSMIRDKKQRSRIDSLKNLILLKRDNTLLVMQEVAQNSADRFFREKVNSLQRGSTPVYIHPQTTETHEDKEVVYNIIQTRKGFFARLADAFRGQRRDTVAMHSLSRKTRNDTATRRIDIADTVADVLSDIKREEANARRWHDKSLARKAQTQQMVGVELNKRISLLLGDIRNDEQRSLQAAVQRDMNDRISVLVKVVVMALTAVGMAVVLLVFVLRDIRRNRAYQQSLMAAKAETERIMAQRERLLLTITHDIKAPAASISGFIELLRNVVTGDKATGYLENIRSSAQHLLQLVGSLLDYHRLESGKMEAREVSFSAAQLARGCVEAMRPQVGAKGLDLVCDTSECGDSLCRGDAFRIKQIIDNLLSNAIKYTDLGRVSLKAAERGGKLVIEVTDTGRGMTREESRRVFDAFTRLPGAQGIEGVGLGLSITREIVNLLGGRIYLNSVAGKGTTFRVVIPVKTAGKDEPSEAEKDTAKPENIVVLKSETPLTADAEAPLKILIVDDDGLQRKLLTEMLGSIGRDRFAISSFASANVALQRFAAERPDVFFIDIEMPEMNGTEIVSRIGSQAHTRLIAMTAHERDIEPELLKAGFNACLFKPFTTERLADVLSRITGLTFNVAKENVADATYINKVETDPASRPAENGRFAKLFEFADGDEQAIKEIAGSFASELEGHIATLSSATAKPDRDAISRTAHKATPLLTMAGTSASAALRALTPEHIGELSDDEVRQNSNAVMTDMKTILEEIRKFEGK